MPDILVTGGGSSLDGLAAALMRALGDGKLPLPEGAGGTPALKA